MQTCDSDLLAPLLEAYRSSNPKPNHELILRYLTEVFHSDPAWQAVIPRLSPDLRQELIDTCQTRMKEYLEVIDVINLAFTTGYSTVTPEVGAKAPQHMVASFQRLVELLSQ